MAAASAGSGALASLESGGLHPLGSGGLPPLGASWKRSRSGGGGDISVRGRLFARAACGGERSQDGASASSEGAKPAATPTKVPLSPGGPNPFAAARTGSGASAASSTVSGASERPGSDAGSPSPLGKAASNGRRQRGPNPFAGLGGSGGDGGRGGGRSGGRGGGRGSGDQADGEGAWGPRRARSDGDGSVAAAAAEASRREPEEGFK